MNLIPNCATKAVAATARALQLPNYLMIYSYMIRNLIKMFWNFHAAAVIEEKNNN